MSLGEAMFTQRAIRRMKPDPIPVEDLHTIVDAAVKAPNGGNKQPGRFLVLTEKPKLQEFGKLYHEAWWAKRRDHEGWLSPADVPSDNKNYQSAMKFADEFKDVPCVVLALAPAGTQLQSVMPSVQNLLLAARGLGIGSTLTMLHPQVIDRVRELLAIPADVDIMCCLPLGYPRGNFGPTSRLPTSQTTFFNAWGSPPPWK